ncbi:hypothetical protein AB9K34_10475 [Sedimentitalea sp. XS_ASV28]|uniref:hypothetical protein n=1 Tax=Sedimentitalea sp. XS_ASV28 TaxID=3241296 RepID=UPI0035164B63
MATSTASAERGSELLSGGGILSDRLVSVAVAQDTLRGLPLLNWDALDRVTIHEITYDCGGIPVSGFLFVPHQPGPHPAIIYKRWLR